MEASPPPIFITNSNNMYARVLSFYISRTKMRSLFVTLQNTRHLQASRVIVESHLHLVLSLWSLDILGNNRSPLMLYSIIIVIFWNFQQWKTSHHVIELELYNNLSMRAVTKTPLWHMTHVFTSIEHYNTLISISTVFIKCQILKLH